MLRILLADDHEVVRRGVSEIISANPAWEVVGEAADGDTAFELALSLRPDIAVLDVSLPHMNGVTLTRRLKQEAPEISVLLFTMRDDDETVNEGLAAGAKGYILKTDTQQHLSAAISAIGARRPYFSPWVSELLLDGLVQDRKRSRLKTFTVRELEVAQLIAEGQSNKAIARDLSISVKTVETHRASAMRKAGVRTAGEFVRFAIKQHLITP
ncbi:response regulator transcription factor [Brevundimonas goettingensis]|uniref:Response regulator transcription factor n=1 Tax=Brevundimonas goettingensis TaxID=2774190 RepID=A0A975C1R7_9CAUL|nr:response regulator transcription factor [Brevundimonas goettingensis]